MITHPKAAQKEETPVTDDDRGAYVVEFLAQLLRTAPITDDPFLAETSRHVLATPGKMVRPILLLDACRAAGGDPMQVLPAALGTECGHVASLVQDDLMDGDGYRRGQPTLHVKYGVGPAVLTADLLIFHTFLSYTRCCERGVPSDRVLAAIRTLSETCIQMCEGQALEARIAGDLDTTEETYLTMIRLKTASICRAATQIGAILAGGPDDAVRALASYGENLGVAFQIVDDMLSFVGDERVVGKPLTSDARNRRVTLPLIYALQSDRPGARRDVTDALESADGARARGRLVKLLAETGALDRSYARVVSYTDEACGHLDLLPHSEARERLRRMAQSLQSRVR